MKLLGIGAAALLAAITVSAAHAASDMSHSGPAWWVSQMDTNKDGSISRDEFNETRTQMFKKLDANGDGTVTTAERRAAVDQWNKDNPSQQVQIGDDQLKEVSLNAFNLNTTNMFDKLDTNKDGMVSQAELDTAHTAGSLDPAMEDNMGAAGNTGGPTGSGAANPSD